MSNGFDAPNPFSAPGYQQPANPEVSNNGLKVKVIAPAIALIIVGCLGFIASIYGVVNAIVSDPPPVAPGAPEWAKAFAEGSVGTSAAIIQSIFLIINIVIIFGGIRMFRFQGWGVCLASSVLAIVNFGTCCCVIGAPIGIWALIVLNMPDVKQAFNGRR
jgi:hypothetical protein